jgi:hypothetical protein
VLILRPVSKNCLGPGRPGRGAVQRARTPRAVSQQVVKGFRPQAQCRQCPVLCWFEGEADDLGRCSNSLSFSPGASMSNQTFDRWYATNDGMGTLVCQLDPYQQDQGVLGVCSPPHSTLMCPDGAFADDDGQPECSWVQGSATQGWSTTGAGEPTWGARLQFYQRNAGDSNDMYAFETYRYRTRGSSFYSHWSFADSGAWTPGGRRGEFRPFPLVAMLIASACVAILIAIIVPIRRFGSFRLDITRELRNGRWHGAQLAN